MTGQNKKLYSVADYISDKKKKKQEELIGTATQTPNQLTGTVIYNGLSNPKDILAEQKSAQQPTTSTPESVDPASPVQTTTVETPKKTTTVTTTTAASPQPTGVDQVTANANVTKPLTQVDIARTQMEQARQKVYDVLNTKFQYNAKASPLYTILDRQYEEQARKAAGEAYARSTANTGGYGSSYATNTASEARRQVMQGFNDQQYDLYQAARDEFLAERESTVEWYNMTKQMYSDVQDEELMSAYESAYGVWDGSNEDAVRTALTEQGVSATNINKIMTALKQEKLTNLQTDYNISEYEDEAAYKSVYRTASALWTGDNESEVRTALLAEGVDAATVNSIIRDLKTGTLSDMTLDDELTAVRESREYKTAMDAARAVWAKDQSEEAVRAALSGYSATVVDDIVASLKQERLTDMQVDVAIKELERTESGELSEEAKQELYDSAAEIYTGQNQQQVAAMLERAGATPEEAAKIVKDLDTVAKAGLLDVVNNVTDIASAVDAKDQLDTARRNHIIDVAVYDEQIKIISGKIMSGINENLNDLESIDYEGLGISEDEWSNMDDVDKKLAVFDAVGQMAQEGVVTRSDYYKMLYNDTKEFFESKDYTKSKTPTRDAVDRAIVIQDLYDSGNLPEDDYKSLLYNVIAPKIEETTLFKSLIKGVKAVDEWGGFDGDWMDNNMAWSQIREVVLQGGSSDDRQWAQMSDDQKEMAVIIARHIANRGESTTNKPTTPNPSLASSPTTRTTLDS